MQETNRDRGKRPTETYVRDQQRPMQETNRDLCRKPKETYVYMSHQKLSSTLPFGSPPPTVQNKRDLQTGQKRPINMTKETYKHDKRDPVRYLSFALPS